MRRRRFWGCYLMHCHAAESWGVSELLESTRTLALPWPEPEFDTGISRQPRMLLESDQSNGGIYGELIKALTLW